jgi:two-component system, chemotaxis family, protein-glutamate methylesterase/glutaminase
VIRVLVVDDSAFARKLVTEMLQTCPEIEVVGAAGSGLEALREVQALRPDVVTVDLNMPVMNGPEFLRLQREVFPVRGIVLSSVSEREPLAVEAIESGALEFVRKPTGLANHTLRNVEAELVAKVLAIAGVPLEKLRREPLGDGHLHSNSTFSSGPMSGAVVLGLSTGGPQHLRQLVGEWNWPMSLGVAAVVHMPPGFTAGFAERLNSLGTIEVLESEPGLEMKAGRLILARAGSHLRLHRQGQKSIVCRLESARVDDLHCPSVDALFRSAAQIYQQGLLGVVLTGMGNDGTSGAAWIKAHGGTVWAEAEESCVVYGMPRAVVEASLADETIPLNRLSERLKAWQKQVTGTSDSVPERAGPG